MNKFRLEVKKKELVLNLLNQRRLDLRWPSNRSHKGKDINCLYD